MPEYTNAHAVVSGAGSGIGRALVLELLDQGARVLATDINENGLSTLIRDAGKSAGALLVSTSDVSDEQSVRALKYLADREFGTVHYLFNNAGVAYNAEPTWSAPAESVRWSYEVNVFGVLNMTRAFVPNMVESGRGHVVNTASIGGFQVSDRIDVWQQGIYASTKFAVVALSEALRIELAEHGITVSVFAPSAVATGIAESGLHRPERLGGATTDASPKSMATMLAAEGMAPAHAARLLLRGVADGQFYIFTDDNLRERIRTRAAEIDLAFDQIRDFRGAGL